MKTATKQNVKQTKKRNDNRPTQILISFKLPGQVLHIDDNTFLSVLFLVFFPSILFSTIWDVTRFKSFVNKKSKFNSFMLNQLPNWDVFLHNINKQAWPYQLQTNIPIGKLWFDLKKNFLWYSHYVLIDFPIIHIDISLIRQC